MTAGRLRVLVLIYSLLLGFGLFAPCLEVQPRFGEYSFVVQALKPEYGQVREYSIAGGIYALFAEGQLFIAAVLLLFSVLFPLWKLGVLWSSLAGPVPERRRGLLVVERLGKYSMLDVLVIAVLVVAVKGLPGGSQAAVRWGLIPFVLAVLLSLKIPHWMRSLDRDPKSD